MSDDSGRSGTSEIGSLIRDARFAFGGVLIDGDPHIIECLDHEAFGDEDTDATLGTAVVSANADLVPFVVETEAEPDPSSTVDPDGGPPRITAFDRLEAAVTDADAVYFLAELGSSRWKRVRHARAGQFGSEEAVDPGSDASVLAAVVVSEATERIGNLPDEVTEPGIDIIDWSG